MMKPGHAVAEAAAQRGSCAGRRAAGGRRSAAGRRGGRLSCICARGERRVAIDRLEVIGDVAIGDSAAARRAAVRSLPSTDTDSCTYAPGPLRGAPVVEAQLMVRDTSRSCESSGRGARSPAASGTPRMRRIGGEGRSDLGRQRRRHALVGVERQNPVVGGQRRGEVLLRDVARPTAARRRGR